MHICFPQSDLMFLLKKKCENYWAPLSATSVFGSFTVTNVSLWMCTLCNDLSVIMAFGKTSTMPSCHVSVLQNACFSTLCTVLEFIRCQHQLQNWKFLSRRKYSHSHSVFPCLTVGRIKARWGSCYKDVCGKIWPSECHMSHVIYSQVSVNAIGVSSGCR